jgi:DNA invertase Pin-like site-specific DNA recombinase
MIAAVYARKSTSQEKATEEAKSVTRQIELARAFAERQGWTVPDEHVYVDDGISGAEFDPRKRPQLSALMAAAHTKPRPFAWVITMKQSRLGRRQLYTEQAVHGIAGAGVQIVYYQTGLGPDLTTSNGRFMVSVDAFKDDAYRESVKLITRETMRRKAERGEVAGGKVYGYVNVGVQGRRDREIVPEQAAVIRRIFQDVADGRGFAKIAQGLNAEGIPCPRGTCWAMTGVREMVFRHLYRGRVVYGKTKRLDPGQAKSRERLPQSEWITREAPHLRIVDDALWQAAHERLERTRRTYLRFTGGRMGGRPEAGLESKNLFAGFLVCGECGGAMHAIKRTSRRGRPRVYYTCKNRRVNTPKWPRNPDRPRGQGCRNAFSAHLGELDTAVVAMLQTDVLTPDVVEAVVERAAALYAAEPDTYTERRERAASEAQRLQEEAQRLTEAVAEGGSIPALVAALRDREQRRADALALVEHLEGLSRPPVWSATVRAEIRRRLADWRALLSREPAIARQIVRKLVDGRLTMTPKVTPEGRYYEVTGHATYGRLFAGVVGVAPG